MLEPAGILGEDGGAGEGARAAWETVTRLQGSSVALSSVIMQRADRLRLALRMDEDTGSTCAPLIGALRAAAEKNLMLSNQLTSALHMLGGPVDLGQHESGWVSREGMEAIRREAVLEQELAVQQLR